MSLDNTMPSHEACLNDYSGSQGYLPDVSYGWCGGQDLELLDLHDEAVLLQEHAATLPPDVFPERRKRNLLFALSTYLDEDRKDRNTMALLTNEGLERLLAL